MKLVIGECPWYHCQKFWFLLHLFFWLANIVNLLIYTYVKSKYGNDVVCLVKLLWDVFIADLRFSNFNTYYSPSGLKKCPKPLFLLSIALLCSHIPQPVLSSSKSYSRTTCTAIMIHCLMSGLDMFALDSLEKRFI